MRLFAAEVDCETIVQTGKTLGDDFIGGLKLFQTGRVDIIEGISLMMLRQ